MLRTEDALGDRQQRGELRPGGGRVARLPGPVGQAGAGGQGVGVLGAEDALGYGTSAVNWSRAAVASPASPAE